MLHVSASPKVRMTPSMMHQQQITDAGHVVILDDQDTFKDGLDYTQEKTPMKLRSGEGAETQIKKYNFVGDLFRGEFSKVSRVVRSGDDRTFAAKVLMKAKREDACKAEFNHLKKLHNERLAVLYEAYDLKDVMVLIMEHLPGEVDVLTYLANKLEYNEQILATIVKQVCKPCKFLILLEEFEVMFVVLLMNTFKLKYLIISFT